MLIKMVGRWGRLLAAIIFLIFISQPVLVGVNSYSHSKGYIFGASYMQNGKTLYVGGNGPNNYTSIQDAINAANDGDTIIVFYNHYYENITIDKAVHLIGVERDGKKPVVDGGESEFTINIVADNCTIKNFVITMNDSITVKISSSFNLIENCYLLNLPKEENGGWTCGYALMLIHSHHTRIFNSTIESKGGCGIAIKMYRSAENIISNNMISGGPDYEALWVIESPNNSFYSNRIDGIECESSNGNFFRNNVFTSCVRIHGSKNNVFENNRFRSMVLYYTVNLTLRNNIFNGSLDINGDKLIYYNTHVIENNTKYLKNGPKILYYKNKPNIIISGEGNLGELIVVNCSNSIIRGVEIRDSSIPILVMYSDNTLIHDCSISYKGKDVGYGIIVGHSKGCVIKNNNISKLKEGILVFSSSNTKIIKNHIEGAKWGIVIARSLHTTVKRNKLRGNSCGIYLYLDLYTIIKRNDIRNNFDGVEMENTLINIVKRNNFIKNSQDTIVYESFINIFFRNHWSRWIVPLPKPILCILLSIPWIIVIYYVIFDFCPRLIPYLII